MHTSHNSISEMLQEHIEAGIEPAPELINKAAQNHRHHKATMNRKKRRHERRRAKSKKRRNPC